MVTYEDIQKAWYIAVMKSTKRTATKLRICYDMKM